MSVVFLNMLADGDLKSQIVRWLIVILCASLCGAVHLLQQCAGVTNSMSNLI